MIIRSCPTIFLKPAHGVVEQYNIYCQITQPIYLPGFKKKF